MRETIVRYFRIFLIAQFFISINTAIVGQYLEPDAHLTYNSMWGPVKRELLLDEYESLFVQSGDELNFLIEADALSAALRAISDRECHILLARVIDEKSFEVIATELGLSYKGAASIYYRTIAKLRKILEV